MQRYVIALICSVFALCAQTATALAAKRSLARPSFEKLLMEKAQSSSVETDNLGGWVNLYQHILLAKFLDENLYKRALIKFARDFEGCKSDRPTDVSYISCGAGVAADAASSLNIYAAETEFRQDAEKFAAQNTGAQPDRLVDVLLVLAKSANMWLAEQTLDRIDTMFRDHPQLLTVARRYQTAMIRARIADARLDQQGAKAALDEIVDIALKERSRRKPMGEDRVVGQDLTELIGRHIRGYFCLGCGHPLAPSAKKWIDAVLTLDEGKDYSDTQYAEHQYLLLAFSSPDSTFTAAERKSYVKRFLRLYAGQGPAAEASVRKTLQSRDETAAAVLIALASYVGGIETDNAIAALVERDEEKHAKSVRQVLKKTIEDSYEQFGLDSRIPEFLDTSARHFQAAGYRHAARVALQMLADRNSTQASKDTLTERVIQAEVYAPALVRLASAQLAGGDMQGAIRHLDEASRLIRAKLRKDWISAGEATVLSLRNFAPALRLIAQKRNEIIVRGGLSRNQSGHDVLFEAMQAAMFGETALALEVAGQRRILADETSRQLKRAHVEASARAERARQIANLNYEAGDVDGALERHKRTTADLSDAARRAFENRLPGGLAKLDDIEPASLAEARARLQDGEALILLHVGSHGLYGFLLDRTGQSLAWRSDIRSQVVENLVRSLRGGGDVSRSAFPLFPFADAAELNRLIFGRVATVLKDYRKLIIVGDGPLQAMPFALLLTQPLDRPASDGTTLRTANPQWLIRSHAIALLPSVRTLLAQRANHAVVHVQKSFLGVGNPQFSDATDATGALRSIDVAAAFKGSAGGLADVTLLRRLVSLPETAEELRTIAELLAAPPEALILGARANERTVRAMNLSDYRIVAFATHGAIAGEVTGTSEPGLVLTPPAAASREDDGYLSLSEIIGLRLSADLVILSACNTATSDGRPKAEGLSGLTRGFFTAGARSILATHWAIPSASSVKITTGLIAHRNSNPATDWADALRATTLTLLDGEGPAEWAHPAYWAGFTAIGVLPLRQ